MDEILDLIESVPEGLPTYSFIITCSILNASLRSVETLARENTLIRKEYASLLRGTVDEGGWLSCPYSGVLLAQGSVKIAAGQVKMVDKP